MAGSELVELKRHAQEIPACPGLARQIQQHNGKGSLFISRDELDWIVAVLDAVLHNPKGYPCVEYDPWKLDYVPRIDKRCVTCQRLHNRLNRERERLFEIARERWINAKKAREDTRVTEGTDGGVGPANGADPDGV